MLVLRIAFFLLLLVFAGAFFWNVVGPVTFEVDERYTGEFREGTLKGRHLSNEGVMILKNWIDTRTSPAWDPYRIGWHQFWYNAVTERYDLKLWVSPPESVDGFHYGIYVAGETLFLRREYYGRNRVLAAEFDAEEMVSILEGFTYE